MNIQKKFYTVILPISVSLGFGVSYFQSNDSLRDFTRPRSDQAKSIYGKAHAPLRADLTLLKLSSTDYKLTPTVQYYGSLLQGSKLLLKFEVPEPFEILQGQTENWIEFTNSDQTLPPLLLRLSYPSETSESLILHFEATLQDQSVRTAISLKHAITEELPSQQTLSPPAEASQFSHLKAFSEPPNRNEEKPSKMDRFISSDDFKFMQ